MSESYMHWIFTYFFTCFIIIKFDVLDCDIVIKGIAVVKSTTNKTEKDIYWRIQQRLCSWDRRVNPHTYIYFPTIHGTMFLYFNYNSYVFKQNPM